MMRGKSRRQLNRSVLQGDGGFSLLELVISIAILAIIIGPLMSAFVVSSHSVSKSRRIADQNAAAQTVYEKIQAKPANDFFYWYRGEDKHNTASPGNSAAEQNFRKTEYTNLLDYFGCKDTSEFFNENQNIPWGAWDVHNKDENHGDEIELVLPNVYQNGAIRYTATVQIRAGQGLWGEGKTPQGSEEWRGKQEDEGIVGDLISGKTMADLNETKFTRSMSFNNIFVQQDDDSNPDKRVLSMIGKKDRITKNKRTIYVRYVQDATDELDNDKNPTGEKIIDIRPIVYYLYDITYVTEDGETVRLHYDLSSSNGDLTATTRKEINGVETKPEAGEEAAFVDSSFPEIHYQYRNDKGNIVKDDMDFYLAFHPYYDATGNVKEEFIIDNTANIKGNTYLVKQTAHEDDSKDYSGIVRLLENHPSDTSEFNMQVHTNMGLQKDMETPLGGVSRFTYMQFYNVSGDSAAALTGLGSDRWYVDGSDLDSFKTLIVKEADEHIYSVYIRIYDSYQFKQYTSLSLNNGYFTRGYDKVEPRYTLIGLKRG